MAAYRGPWALFKKGLKAFDNRMQGDLDKQKENLRKDLFVLIADY